MPPEAIKLLERMRRSKEGWTRQDLDMLYLGFGFVMRNGSSHDIVTHPDYPQLRETLPRHRKVAAYLVRNAVKRIDKLLELQMKDEEQKGQGNDE